jgi:hypothetical protein
MNATPKLNEAAEGGSSPVPGSGFRPGDVAYIASWNYGRRLILSINGDIAECLDMQGHECRHSLRGLQTLSEWLNTSRRLAEDSDLKMSEVTAYIKAMSAPYETPPQWVAALKDIQNREL